MKALLLVVISALVEVVGCGDGGPGQPGSFPPPTRGGGSTVFAGSGSDRGGAGDKGGGVTPAIGAPSAPDGTQPVQTTPPSPCTTNEQCTGGRCSQQGRPGYCLQACDATCATGYQCVTSANGSFCYAPCSTASDCPRVSGLSAACVLDETTRYCFWGAAEPS